MPTLFLSDELVEPVVYAIRAEIAEHATRSRDSYAMRSCAAINRRRATPTEILFTDPLRETILRSSRSRAAGDIAPRQAGRGRVAHQAARLGAAQTAIERGAGKILILSL